MRPQYPTAGTCAESKGVQGDNDQWLGHICPNRARPSQDWCPRRCSIPRLRAHVHLMASCTKEVNYGSPSEQPDDEATSVVTGHHRPLFLSFSFLSSRGACHFYRLPSLPSSSSPPSPTVPDSPSSSVTLTFQCHL